MSEETKVNKDDVANMRLAQAFEANLMLVDSMSKQLSSRQLGRVLRSLMGAPLRDSEKLVDAKEKAVFEAGMQIMDAKVLLIMEHQEEINKALKATKKEAMKQEKKEKGE